MFFFINAWPILRNKKYDDSSNLKDVLWKYIIITNKYSELAWQTQNAVARHTLMEAINTLIIMKLQCSLLNQDSWFAITHFFRILFFHSFFSFSRFDNGIIFFGNLGGTSSGIFAVLSTIWTLQKII